VPGHRVHCYVDRVLFGKTYWRLHRQMDCAVFWLGKNHRRLYHDIPTAVFIAKTLYPSDPNNEEAAFTHIWLDTFCTAYPIWKMFLEQLAYADARRRKRERQEKKRRRGRQQVSRAREQKLLREFCNNFRFFKMMVRC